MAMTHVFDGMQNSKKAIQRCTFINAIQTVRHQRCSCLSKTTFCREVQDTAKRHEQFSNSNVYSTSSFSRSLSSLKRDARKRPQTGSRG